MSEVNPEVKRYEVNWTPGGFEMIPGEDWVRAEDFDAVADRNADLEKTVAQLLLLQEHGGRIILREIPNAE